MMLSSQARAYDHKLVEIRTFEPAQNLRLVQKVKKYVCNISNNSADRLIKNYFSIDFSSQLAVSLFLQNEQIRGFSTVSRRSFYPNKVVRILNRFWKDPKTRLISKIIGREHLIVTCKQQLQIAQNKGFKRFFISRDRNLKYMKKLTGILNETTKLQWFFHSEKIPVCNPSSQTCWQWVIFSNLNTTDIKNWVKEIYE